MSVARRAFLLRMKGVRAASQSNLLLGQTTDDDELQAARLLRNGLSVTCFAALEGFVKARTGEVCTWLAQQGLPYSQYPDTLHKAARQRAVKVLAALLQRDPELPEFTDTLVQLGDSWSRMNSGGAWILPHAALLWPQSNLKAGEAIAILQGLGVANNWPEVTQVVRAAGFSASPTDSAFNEIAARRNASAHDADYDTDIVLLRTVPDHLTAFAYGFDALISSAARAIPYGPVPVGMAAIGLTRLDQDPGSDTVWNQYQGSALRRDLPVTASLAGSISDVVLQIRPIMTNPTDVLVVRTWNGIEHTVTEWHTPGLV